MEFHHILKSKRKSLNLTQKDLADKLYVTRQTLSRWENNLGYPNLDTLVKLSEILNTPLDELLKRGQHNLIDQISKDVRDKDKYKKMLFVIITLILIIFLWLCFLSYGRLEQVEFIDRFNPFIKTQEGYAVLPNNYSKMNQKKDVYVSDDSFGDNGSWLKISFGKYDQKNKWAKIKHRGSYVYSYRLIRYDQIPKDMQEQTGLKYYSYNKKAEPNRINNDSLLPFK